MKIIYFVVSLIFAALSWICTQTVWEYQYILQYIFVFITGIFISLIFVSQEDSEGKYRVFSITNIIYIALIIGLIVVLKDYDLAEMQTSVPSFWKAAVIMNGIQGVLLIAIYKIKDLYKRM